MLTLRFEDLFAQPGDEGVEIRCSKASSWDLVPCMAVGVSSLTTMAGAGGLWARMELRKGSLRVDVLRGERAEKESIGTLHSGRYTAPRPLPAS